MKEFMQPVNREDFEDFATLFEHKLQPSPINIERHLKQAEGKPLLENRLQIVIDYCFEYTKDVAKHERLRRQGLDNETAEADAKRTETHEGTMMAIVAYTNALEEFGLDNPDEPETIPNKNQSRVHFGKFAILLTLNRFKDQIQLFKNIKEHTGEIDYSKLKSLIHTEIELLTIEYVETLSEILDSEDKSEEKENILREIEEKLHQDESHILQAFIELYEKSYK